MEWLKLHDVKTLYSTISSMCTYPENNPTDDADSHISEEDMVNAYGMETIQLHG